MRPRCYGFFGIVLGMVFWIYLIAQVTVYAAELNVVLADHRWPRQPDRAASRQMTGCET